MAGKPGRSGGARPGAGRKPKPFNPQSKPITIGEDEGECSVYVIHEEAEPSVCKIGVAANVARRFGTIQVCSWRVLRLAYVVTLPSKSAAHAVERQVHSALAALHVRGEWFKVHHDRAHAEVNLAVSQLSAAFEAASRAGSHAGQKAE